MDKNTSVKNFDVNENLPVIDNHNVSSSEILNRSAENKLSVVDAEAAFFQSSSMTENQVLTNVNNKCQNEKPTTWFTSTNNSSFVSNNSAENIFLPSETGTTKTDNIIVYETASNIETSNNISANLSSKANPLGNVNFLPDVLSEEICSDNQKNLINIAQCDGMSTSKVENIDNTSISTKELIDEKNNSFTVESDLVDFSFKEPGNVSNLTGNFTAVDSFSKHTETSPKTNLEKICLINVTANKQGTTNAELLQTEDVKVLDEPTTKTCTDSGILQTPEKCAVVLGDSTNNDSRLDLSEIPETKAAGSVVATKEVPCSEPFTLGISAGNEHGAVNSEEAAFQLFENPSSNKVYDSSPLNIEKVNVSGKPFEQLADSGFENKLPGNPNQELDEISIFKIEKISPSVSDKFLEKFSDAAFKLAEISPLKVENVSCNVSDKSPEQFSDSGITFKVPENSSINEQDEFLSLKVENISFGMSDTLLEQFSNLEIASKVPENTLSEEMNEVSPLKIENVSFNMFDKSCEQFSDPNISFKVPENSSNVQDEVSLLKVENVSFNMSDKPLEQASDHDIAFNGPEIPSSNEDRVSPLKVENVSLDVFDKPVEQFSDFPFKVPEVPSYNPLEQLRNPELAFKISEKALANEDDEQFVDAAQFFRDPNSFQFLESIRTSTVQPGPEAPRSSLYVNFDPLHSKFQTNVPRLDNRELISAAVQDQRISTENFEISSPEVVNKQLVDIVARESIGNILISFDSPKSSLSVDSKMPVEIQSPPKMFTEEELQQKLKIHYLETQDAYLKKQREMEMEIAKRDELLKTQEMVIKEFCGISFNFSEDIKSYRAKVISLEEENEKLKEDLKTSAEDLQSVENTFTDFYKRYEQCKGMLKTYKDNEEHLKQTILDLQDKAKEQEKMYNMLQKRTEEMLEKANVEVDNAKRSGEAQVTVLKAQLKKAEMKISSLESDNKQIKMENSQLGGICDDLMAKVSNS